MQSKQTLETIKAEFLQDDVWKKTTPLARKTVRRWMSDSDIEVLGATNRLLFDKEHWPRVTPPLSLHEMMGFRQKYYGRCLLEYSTGETNWQWADEGFDLSHGVVHWISDVLRDKDIAPKTKAKLQSWLARILSHPACFNCLQIAVYDHLILDRKLGRRFAHWRDDPQIRWIFEPDEWTFD